MAFVHEEHIHLFMCVCSVYVSSKKNSILISSLAAKNHTPRLEIGSLHTCEEDHTDLCPHATTMSANDEVTNMFDNFVEIIMVFQLPA